MKTITIVVTALLVASSLAFWPPWAMAGQSFHFTSKGASAESSYYDPVMRTWGNLGVQRGGSTNDPNTWLQFFAQTCDELGCRGMGAYGPIPNRDFTVTGNKTATLDTNTATNPNIYVYWWDTPNGEYMEHPFPGGFIVFTWEKTGTVENDSNGTIISSIPNYVTKQVGHSTWGDAFTTGNIFGTVIESRGGSLGMSHGTEVDITRTK